MAYSFFPEIQPYKTHRIKVSDSHELYVEEVGNPNGQPAVFLHGGPGAGLTPKHRRFFDPKHYRLILFDQRGCGKSQPHASLVQNTTWDLVEDIEKIRGYFGIKKWLVFGGSWGSTLALAYAETHPEAVSALVLRGIFLCRKEEIDWFYQKGCDLIFPDNWEKYIAPIPQAERGEMILAYYRRLTSEDQKVRIEAARAWSGWEGSTIKLLPDPDTIANFEELQMSLAIARIECHFFINKCWFKTDNQLIENVGRIKHIPAVIVHGRYDVVCPVKNAWDLHKAWPESKLQIIADAGHSHKKVCIAHHL